MLRGLGVGAATALATASCLLIPAGASATSTEFGNRCTGDATEVGWTALGIANGEEPPTSGSAGPWELRGARDAVITRWKAQVGAGIGPLPQQLVAFNYAAEDEARNLGESAVETLVEGNNEFTTRIPVPEYAHIGLRGPLGTLYCDNTDHGLLGVVEGDFPVGSSRPFEMRFPKGVPVMAVVEPDFDSDGYGDETQDQCNAQAWTHGPCEYFGILVPQRLVTRQAIWVQLEATMTGTATITGTISVPRRKGIRAVKLTPVAVTLAARSIVTARVQIPRGVRRYLARLPRTKGVRIELLTVGFSEHGNEARALRRFKLKGTKRDPLPGRGH